jgi:GTP-binding nuclear protein Ran
MKMNFYIITTFTNNQQPTTYTKPTPIMTTNTAAKIKVCFVGSGDSGKTCYRRYLTLGRRVDVDTEPYVPTLGVEVDRTNYYVIWDTAGQDKYGGLRDGYFIGSKRVVFFVDASSKSSVRALPNLFRDYRRVCDQSVTDDMAILVTKCDIAEEDVVAHCKRFANKQNIRVFEISLLDTPTYPPTLEEIFPSPA